MLLKLQSESDRTETAGKKPKEEMKERRPNKGSSGMMCRKNICEVSKMYICNIITLRCYRGIIIDHKRKEHLTAIKMEHRL